VTISLGINRSVDSVTCITVSELKQSNWIQEPGRTTTPWHCITSAVSRGRQGTGRAAGCAICSM